MLGYRLLDNHSTQIDDTADSKLWYNPATVFKEWRDQGS